MAADDIDQLIGKYTGPAPTKPGVPANPQDDVDALLNKYGGSDSEAIAKYMTKPEKTWADTGKGLVKGTLNALPFGGALVGGGIGMASGLLTGPGAVAASPVGAVVGAGLGGAAGKSLQQTLGSWTGLGDELPNTVTGRMAEIGKTGLVSAAGEGAGQLAAQGLSKVPGLLSRFVKLPKDTAPEIIAASKRLGIDPTEGMVAANQEIGNIESSLSQQPTIAGGKVLAGVNKVKEGLKGAAENVVGERTGLSSFEIGEGIKNTLTQKIGEKLAPLKMSYDELAQSYSNVKLDPSRMTKAANGLRKLDIAEFPGTESGMIVNRYADMMEGAKSATSLRQLETEAGRAMRTAQQQGNGNQVNAYSTIIGALKKAQQSHIIRSAVESMPATKAGVSEGKNIAQEVITQLKDTNKGYRALMQEIEGISGVAKVKGKSPQAFLDAIDDVSSEEISKRMFNTKNFKSLNSVKEFLPDEFELLRKAKLDEIANKSMTKGQLDPVKLINNLKGMEKEASNVIFGPKGNQAIADIKTVIDSTPNMVGPSGTPKGSAWRSLFSPTHYGQEVSDGLQYLLLKSQTKTIPGLIKGFESIAPNNVYKPGFQSTIGGSDVANIPAGITRPYTRGLLDAKKAMFNKETNK